MLVSVKQYNLGMWFIVHTLCNYCEMVATAACNKVSKYLEVAWKSCKLRMRVKFNILVRTNIFHWFPASPTYSHLGTVSSSHGIGTDRYSDT